MAIAPPQGYWEQQAAQEKKKKQTATPPAPRKSEADKLRNLEELAERGIDQLVEKAVQHHNARVITGPRRVEQTETGHDELPRKKSPDEIVADEVDKLNKERERRGYFGPKKGK